MTRNENHDVGYFDLINMVVQEEPVNDYDKTMLGMAASIGIEKGKPFGPPAHTGQILERAAKDAQEYLIEIQNGVGLVRAEGQPGWTRLNLREEDIAEDRLYVYENADGMIDYQRRAAVDYWAINMPAVLGSGTMYNVAFVDRRTTQWIRPGITGSGCQTIFLPLFLVRVRL